MRSDRSSAAYSYTPHFGMPHYAGDLSWAFSISWRWPVLSEETTLSTFFFSIRNACAFPQPKAIHVGKDFRLLYAFLVPQPPVNPELAHDEEYFEILASALRVCADYKPMFGQGRAGGLTLDQFREMYGADPFYSWIGLDSPKMYAAHKAAGGMTSIYRQVGIGGQWVFNKVLQHTMGLTEAQANWTYEVPTADGTTRKLSLDGRITLTDVVDQSKRERVQAWMLHSLSRLKIDPKKENAPKKGVVFEVRQGYKSKDSKRQNADIANAAHAYVEGYMPSVVLLSLQIDGDIATRYTEARWLLLVGTNGGTSIDSTYAFCRDVLGYDLAKFFERNATRLKAELEKVLAKLLKPDGK